MDNSRPAQPLRFERVAVQVGNRILEVGNIIVDPQLRSAAALADFRKRADSRGFRVVEAPAVKNGITTLLPALLGMVPRDCSDEDAVAAVRLGYQGCMAQADPWRSLLLVDQKLAPLAAAEGPEAGVPGLAKMALHFRAFAINGTRPIAECLQLAFTVGKLVNEIQTKLSTIEAKVVKHDNSAEGLAQALKGRKRKTSEKHERWILTARDKVASCATIKDLAERVWERHEKTKPKGKPQGKIEDTAVYKLLNSAINAGRLPRPRRAPRRRAATAS